MKIAKSFFARGQQVCRLDFKVNMQIFRVWGDSMRHESINKKQQESNQEIFRDKASLIKVFDLLL